MIDTQDNNHKECLLQEIDLYFVLSIPTHIALPLQYEDIEKWGGE